MKNFNELTPAETERLALLLEEIGEAQHVIGKILRHGFELCNPYDEHEFTNQELLEKELGHVMFAIELMIKKQDISDFQIKLNKAHKFENIQEWLHHNEV